MPSDHFKHGPHAHLYTTPEGAEEYEAKNEDAAKMTCADLEKYVPWAEDGWVCRHAVDFGCGPGLSSVWLASRGDVGRVTLLDPSETMLARARQNVERAGLAGKAVCVLGEASSLQEGDCDLIVAGFSIHHVGPGWREALGQLARALAPGGVLAVHEMTPETMAHLGHGDDPALMEVSREAICAVAALAGLELASSWTYPTMMRPLKGKEVPFDVYGLALRRPRAADDSYVTSP